MRVRCYVCRNFKEDNEQSYCDRCFNIKDKYPELFDFIVETIENALDKHTDDYYHNHRGY